MKRRWTLNVIPWIIRIVGLVIDYYLLEIESMWFIPLSAFIAFNMGIWLNRRWQMLKRIWDDTDEQ